MKNEEKDLLARTKIFALDGERFASSFCLLPSALNYERCYQT